MNAKAIKEKLRSKKGLCLLLLCLLLCFSLAACKGKEDNKKPVTDVSQGEGDTDKDQEADEQDVIELTESGYYLVKDGASAYKIVIPENATDMIKEASKDLQYFLAEATGVTLEIVTDREVKGTGSVISLGWTGVAKELGVSVTEEDNLETSGYLIQTVADSVVIMDKVNGDGEGVLYGVHDFLKDAIGLIFYASDEINYEEKDSVPVYVYDNIVKPSFDVRSLTFYDVRVDESYKHRMRLVDLYNWTDMGFWGHNQVSLISSHQTTHPEWFSSDGRQLCWSAGDEMETAFAEAAIQLIMSKPEATYFMFAQEDVGYSCTCEKCMTNISSEKYGSYSGLQVVFLNHVIEKVEAWREKNAPQRDIRYICFAYQMTSAAPVKKDSDGKTVPYHKECQPSDKLYICLAPIAMDFSAGLDEKVNAATNAAVHEWGAIASGRVVLYEYATNFKHYFLNYNNFDVVGERFKTYYENGTTFMYSQGPVQAAIPSFSEMRIFVESQLMWNVNQKYDDLVNEFMAAYFKDAAKEMRRYYDYIRKNYEAYESLGGDGGIYASIDEAYNLEVVGEMEEIIDDALQAILPLRDTDRELFETLYYRIKKESLSILWLKLEKFALGYSDEELNKLATEFYWICEHFNLTEYAEGRIIGNKFFDYMTD